MVFLNFFVSLSRVFNDYHYHENSDVHSKTTTVELPLFNETVFKTRLESTRNRGCLERGERAL